MKPPRPDTPLGRALAAALADGRATAGPPPRLPRPGPPAPDESEAAFTQRVIDLARSFGWLAAHFAPARVVRRGRETYETPVRGDGKGFMDLVLARGGRMLGRELKVGDNVPSAEQELWVRESGSAVWRPEQWELIVATLEDRP